jgi:NTE family protein
VLLLYVIFIQSLIFLKYLRHAMKSQDYQDLCNPGLDAYIYRHTLRNYDITITKADSENATIKAPYIIDDDHDGYIEPSITLKFQLVVSDDKGRSSNPSHVNIRVKRVQRAMIFQGGVAIGAYEAGVFQALVNKISEEQRKRGLENKRPLFDIVAGSSIGACNAAVVVSNAIKNGAVKNKSWEHSAKELIRFWKDQRYPLPTGYSWADALVPIFHSWWEFMHDKNNELKSSTNIMMKEFVSNANPYLEKFCEWVMRAWNLEPDFWKDYFINGWYIPATGEAARRYYSARQCEFFGVWFVASGIFPQPLSAFGKFFDFSDWKLLSNFTPFPRNYIPRPDNKHFPLVSLKETLKKFVDFPINTKEPDPRFLLVTVNVETGDAVTIDSYEKHSEYGGDQTKHTIFYEKGVEIPHVLASGAFPDLFDYPKFNVKESQKDIEIKHIFWDGNLRSTTPLQEVIQAHRDYWYKTRKKARRKADVKEDEYDVPDLEIYIADVWPYLNEEPTSYDLDFVESRKLNILFNDKTDYDEKVANVVSDYSGLVRQLNNLAKRCQSEIHSILEKLAPSDNVLARQLGDIADRNQNEIDSILEKHAHSVKRNGQKRRYKDLLGGRFRLTNVVRIDRKDDGNEVFDMLFDYSSTSIENLMRDGCSDTWIQLIREGLMAIESKIGNLKELEDDVKQIEKGIKVANSYDPQPIERFINKVQSLPDEVGQDGSIKEEKAFVVDAAQRLKDIITDAHTKCTHA